MASVAYRVETGPRDFVTIHVEVDPDVAAVLAEREAPLKELPFSALANEKNDRAGLDPDTLTDREGKRRQTRRPMPTGNPWDGPRLSFSYVIGTTAIWSGPPARFQFCGGRRLGPDEMCLDCDRTGKDHLIPSPAPDRLPRRPRAEKSRSGKRLKGGLKGKR